MCTLSELMSCAGKRHVEHVKGLSPSSSGIQNHQHCRPDHSKGDHQVAHEPSTSLKVTKTPEKVIHLPQWHRHFRQYINRDGLIKQVTSYTDTVRSSIDLVGGAEPHSPNVVNVVCSSSWCFISQ